MNEPWIVNEMRMKTTVWLIVKLTSHLVTETKIGFASESEICSILESKLSSHMNDSKTVGYKMRRNVNENAKSFTTYGHLGKNTKNFSLHP